MKRKSIIYFAVIILLFAQSCSKNNQSVVTKSTSPVSTGSGFHLDGAGQYATFRISSANGYLSAGIQNLSLADGGTATMAAYTGLAHQQWQITDLGTGYYKIMNNGSGKFMQSYLYGGAQRFIQVYANNSDAQQWQIVFVGPGYYEIVNKATGLSLTNSGSGILSLTPYANNNTQWWNFTIMANQAYRDDNLVNFFHRPKVTGTAVAFDQGNSIPLSNGKVLWMTQDAWDASQLQGNGFFACNAGSPYHNSSLLQPSVTNWDPLATPNVTTNNSPGQPLQVLPTQPGEIWTWPGQGIEIDGHVYVLCTEGGDGSNYFSTHDQTIYDFTENLGGTNWGTAVRKTAAGLSGQDLTKAYIEWSVGMVDGKDGYVYVYGYYNYAPGTNPFISHNSAVYVARFLKSASEVTNWTFWNGTSFVPNLTADQMKSIGSGTGGLSNVCVSYVNGKYVLMDMDYGFSCDPKQHDIYLATSNSPTGPFTAFKDVYTIPDVYQGHIAQFYTALIHPEFVNGHNELLLTYCLNFYTACASSCSNGLDPNYYQIKGIRVPYSLVGIPNGQ